MAITNIYAAQDLAVVVDLHFGPPEGDALKRQLMTDNNLQQQFAEAIKDLAKELELQQNGSVALELLNEPACNVPLSNWPKLQLHYVELVRALAPELPIVVTGCGAPEKSLSDLDLTHYSKDQNIIYTFHYYEPFAYTHQNAFYGVKDYALPYPPDPTLDWLPHLAPFDPQKPTALAYAKHDIPRYLRSGFDRKMIVKQFSEIAVWAKKNGIPSGRILVGEFGAVIGSTPINEAPRSSELAWLQDVSSTADGVGFSHAFWIYPRKGSFNFDQKKDFLRADVARAVGLHVQ
jgi:hypothetical protein